jgi:hypothetical protein
MRIRNNLGVSESVTRLLRAITLEVETDLLFCDLLLIQGHVRFYKFPDRIFSSSSRIYNEILKLAQYTISMQTCCDRINIVRSSGWKSVFRVRAIPFVIHLTLPYYCIHFTGPDVQYFYLHKDNPWFETNRTTDITLNTVKTITFK